MVVGVAGVWRANQVRPPSTTSSVSSTVVEGSGTLNPPYEIRTLNGSGTASNPAVLFFPAPAQPRIWSTVGGSRRVPQGVVWRILWRRRSRSSSAAKSRDAESGSSQMLSGPNVDEKEEWVRSSAPGSARSRCTPP